MVETTIAHAKIDWLSFTLPERVQPRSGMQLRQNAEIAVKGKPSAQQLIFDGQHFNPTAARSPYRIGLSREDNGVRIAGSSHTETTLYEVTGRGCEPLAKDNSLRNGVLSEVMDRLTRFDYAIDIVSEIRPSEFTNARDNRRIRSISHISSDKGETVYVGSPKSDRFVRVYRYNDPHPRSKFLRVEFVARRKLAREAAAHYLATKDEGFTASIGETYGFRHACWRSAILTDGEPIRTRVSSRSDQDTVSWLYKQVAPAMRRLIDSGALDVTDFLDFVYNEG